GARRDARVVVMPNTGRGIVAALETGREAARGRIIARIDADDVMRPERLARQVAWLQRDPALGLVGCGVALGGDRARQAGYAAHVGWLNGLQAPQQTIPP